MKNYRSTYKKNMWYGHTTDIVWNLYILYGNLKERLKSVYGNLKEQTSSIQDWKRCKMLHVTNLLIFFYIGRYCLNCITVKHVCLVKQQKAVSCRFNTTSSKDISFYNNFHKLRNIVGFNISIVCILGSTKKIAYSKNSWSWYNLIEYCMEGGFL